MILSALSTNQETIGKSKCINHGDWFLIENVKHLLQVPFT